MNLYTHVLELVLRQFSGFIACLFCKSLAFPGESIFDQKWPSVQPGLVALAIRAVGLSFHIPDNGECLRFQEKSFVAEVSYQLP